MPAQALPIFLARLADPITAVLISITVVLIFGALRPKSFCLQPVLAINRM